jgi:hypothetical protein
VKRYRRLFISTLLAVLVVVLAVPVSASITPDSVEATLNPGECVVTDKTVEIPELAPQADVVFAFDLTGSMGGILDTAKAQAGAIIADLDALGADIQYGVMSYMDYPDSYNSCGYSASYGTLGVDYSYSLDQAITNVSADVITAINGLVLGFGNDGPEAYTRFMYESHADLIGETNPTEGAVGWRPGSKKIVVNFGDNIPHDCNLNEGLYGGTWTTGGDPGRDEIMGTADDLDLQTVLALMASEGVILLECHSSTYASDYWTYWTGITGGGFFLTTSGTLPDDIVTAVTAGLTVPTVYDLHLEVMTPGFESWLSSVVPSSYPEVEPGDIVDFEETICVPLGTDPGVYVFVVSAVDEFCVSYGDQTVTITVPGEVIPPQVPGITGWGIIAAGIILAVLIPLALRRRKLSATSS